MAKQVADEERIAKAQEEEARPKRAPAHALMQSAEQDQQRGEQPDEDSIDQVQRRIHSSYFTRNDAIDALKAAAKVTALLAANAQFSQWDDILQTLEVIDAIKNGDLEQETIKRVLDTMKDVTRNPIIMKDGDVKEFKVKMAVAALEAQNQKQKEVAQKLKGQHNEQQAAATHLKQNKHELKNKKWKDRTHTKMYEVYLQARSKDDEEDGKAGDNLKRYLFDIEHEQGYMNEMQKLALSEDLEIIRNTMQDLVDAQSAHFYNDSLEAANGEEVQSGWNIYMTFSGISEYDLLTPIAPDANLPEARDQIVSQMVTSKYQIDLLKGLAENMQRILRGNNGDGAWVHDYLSEFLTWRRGLSSFNPHEEGDHNAANRKRDKKGKQSKEYDKQGRQYQSVSRKQAREQQEEIDAGIWEAHCEKDDEFWRQEEERNIRLENNHLKFMTDP
jgi:hypothetical protein